MTSRELYLLHRQVEDLRNTLTKADRPFLLEKAVNHAKELSDELFNVVGKLAAFEIDGEYRSKKNNNTD
ncbi:MAG: hypothetical protein HDS83_03125 [Bacteroidales bacterium]|nr:hypothetical protein [Bacteroidales bacterium]